MKTRSARRETPIGEEPPESDFIRGRIVVDLDPASHCETLIEPVAAEVLRHEVRATPAIGRSEKEDPAGCGECHAELRHIDGDKSRCEYRVSEVCPGCICPVLSGCDCLAEPEMITDDTVTVGVTAATGDALQSLVAELGKRAPSVTVDWVLWNGESRSNGSAITQRQQEAVRTALEIGYYDRPRTATLNDLAQRLGITKSAVSQRLNAAETKLVKSAFDP